MTLYEIHKNNEISVRSYNVCRANGIDNINTLKEYYLANGSFEKLQNCGYKSNKELIDICNKFHLIIEQNMIKESYNESINKIQLNLTRIQREVINSFIYANTNSLSARTKNAISLFLNNNFSIRNFSEKILSNKHFNIGTLENIGKKSIPELENYISIIKDFIANVNESADERQLIILKNNFLIQRTFSLPQIPNEILESEYIFLLTNFLLDKNVLFTENQTIILKQALKIYQGEKELNLEEIAERNNLTRERVRQIRKTCIEELSNKLLFIKSFNDNLFQNYGLDLSANLLEIKENIVNRVNTLNRTNFSKEFIGYILAVYLSDDFYLLGNIEDLLLPKFSNSRSRHNWSNFYLINKYLSIIDYTSFVNDVSERINERIEETYTFNFKSYLSRFIKDFDVETINTALPIAEKILIDEFGLYLDVNDNLIFQRNTVKQVFEYAIEVLENIGEPSKLIEIYDLLEKNNPGITKSHDALRGSLQRTTEIIYFGRSSTYGLKKWESERNNIKGGTIKDIVTEYLKKNNEPIHIYEILEEIHKFRADTNAKNVITNLKLDPQKQFVIFNQSFIGLNNNSYHSNLVDLPKFLGKAITKHIRKNHSIDIDTLNHYYCGLLNITNKNMNYIIQQLIDNKFININEQKKLTV